MLNNPALLFALKSCIIAGLFSLYYLLVLRDRRLHVFNRLYILLAICASLLFPLLTIDWAIDRATKSSPVIKAFSVVAGEGEKETIIDSSITNSHETYWGVLPILYCIISLMLLFRLLMGISRLYLLGRKGEKQSREGYKIVKTADPNAPFSFFHLVFWNEEIPEDSAEGQKILAHELAHVHQKHSYDHLLAQLISSIFWFNPFLFFLRRELTQVHEYLADGVAIADGEPQSLAAMLLTTKGCKPTIAHSFFHSPIKRRLNMLKKHTTRLPLLRMASVIPLLALTLSLFSFSWKEKPLKSEHKLTVLIDAGHGGEDNGAVYNGIKEKDLTLRIAKKLAAVSNAHGVEAHLTRGEDDYVTLDNRVNISNSLHPDAYISIHVNMPTENLQNAKDFEVFICSRNKNTEQIAQSRQLGTAVISELNKVGISIPHLSDAGLHVLRANTVPSILIEFGDMTKEKQMNILTTDEQLEKLCNSVLNGIVLWKEN